MLARHCLECHDSVSKEGGLDLSRKGAAFAGGDSGRGILPGKSDESLVWQHVASDDMPQNRAPLSAKEKDLLRRWIDQGAVWSIEVLNPDAYLHDSPAVATWLQRLTLPEYVETIRSLTGVEIEEEARRLLPRDQRADGFTNTAYNLGVDLEHVGGYARLAQVIVSRMDVSAFAAEHASCRRLDDACLRELIATMGKRLLRGPLTEPEIDAYLGITRLVVREGGDFTEAVSYVIEAMLQSPRFLYRVERQLGTGELRAADDYELASRLSYIIWGGPPDRELLRAAEAGELSSSDNLESQVRRMLEDRRAVVQSKRFIHEWMSLDRLASLRPNPLRFPQWDERLAADMRDETLAFFEDLVWKQNRPLADLLNARFTHATPRLAHHYGLLKKSGSGENKPDSGPQRVTAGLLALYRFSEAQGERVRDLSGAGDPLPLRIADPRAVRWQPDGLTLHASTLIVSETPPVRLINALRKSNAITLEAWITPADSTQTGPARIVTLSNGPNSRNVTLGQAGDRIETRLRTTRTSENGIPALESKPGVVRADRMHVVYTRDAAGNATLYIDGQPAGQRKVEGDFSNWSDRFLLAVGNELSGDRPWRGTLHLLAAYDRALSVAEVSQNHAAGGGSADDGLGSLIVSAAWQQADKRGLLALYRFDEGQGDVIRDRSESGERLDLKIENSAAVTWSDSGLTVRDATLISTAGPAHKVINGMKKSRSLTVEAWVTPADVTQDGPARIVSLSSGSGARNLTVGQEGHRYDVRLRAARTDQNGMPSLPGQSGSVQTSLTHLVYTKDASGQARLFVNGLEQSEADVGGDLAKWDDNFRLTLANETSKDRPWRGTYHLLALYDRALTAEEIQSRGGGTSRYDLADHPARGGLLTQGSVLTIGGDDASMVTRGLFVLHDLLYSRVGNPPACIDTTPVPTKPGMSMRAAAEARLANSACSGCHARFEPLAFGLEKFDGIGAWHETDEHGNRLREDGEILFPGRREAVSYSTSAELMDLLAASERVQMGMTRKVTQFALGRPLVAADLPHLERIHETARKHGGTYPALITAIVTSDLVRMTRTEAE